MNVNRTSPTAIFLYGGITGPAFQPFVPFSVPFAAPNTLITWSGQLIALDFTSPTLLAFSQGIQVTVATGTSGPLTLPLGDDEAVQLSMYPCNASAGTIPFYGTNYTSCFIISNGRVSFGGFDTDFSPTVAEALTDSPFLGFWTDLDPSAGGSMSTNSPPGALSVMWQSVRYYAETAAVSFSISFDGLNGDVSLDLSGVVQNPQTGGAAGGDAQFLGISKGNLGATDPGAQAFGFLSSPFPALATHMLYDFWNGQIATRPNGIGLVQSIQNLQTAAGILTFRPVTIGGTPGYFAFGY